MELYKKHRPRELEDIIGNADVVATLRSMLRRPVTMPRTLLFVGPAGTGKTTLARIVASKIGVRDMDLVECNSSSFRGIDTIREVSRLMGLMPAQGPFRCWIFDEVHKWTNDAQNAALKILEDTPRHVFFILCTTDPQKLLPAVISRCTDFVLSAFSEDQTTRLIRRVAKAEKIDISEDLCFALHARSAGSPRQALVLLDRVKHLPQEEREKALKELSVEDDGVLALCRALHSRHKWALVTKQIAKVQANDPEQVRWAVLGYAKAILMRRVDHQAYLMIQAFANPFYETKQAGLVAACFEAIHADGDDSNAGK